jgi:hypothetical protein
VVNKQIITDEELVKQFAQKAMEEPVKEIKTESPSNLVVELPGGFITQEGSLINKAKVRELTGVDEEIIARSESEAKALQVILQRGLEELGDKKPSENDLDALLAGDRDSIVLGIRCATFGNEAEYRLSCDSCYEEQNIKIDLKTDIKYKKLEDPYKRTWEVGLKIGKAILAFPNGLVQKKLANNVSNKTVSELNTILLAGCVMSINGISVTGTQDVLNLGMADREAIATELFEHNPGPRLMEVNKACKACGKDINIPLSLAALFRLQRRTI